MQKSLPHPYYISTRGVHRNLTGRGKPSRGVKKERFVLPNILFYRGVDIHLLHAFDFNISASALGQNYISIIYMYVELFRILDLPIMYIFLGLILENKKRILLEIKKF